jgi:hypothetical protein
VTLIVIASAEHLSDSRMTSLALDASQAGP